MGIALGNTTASTFKLGDAQVSAIYLGGTSAWTAAAPTITITSQPSAQTASSGAATFSVSATNSASETLTYQWQRQALGTGSYANISGATSATLSLTGLTIASNNGDNYLCVVSSATASSVTSNSATLTVAAAAALLSIARSNGTSNFTEGGTASNPTFTRGTGSNDPQINSNNGISRYSWTAGGTATVTLYFGFNEDEGNFVQAAIEKRSSSGTVTRVHTFDNATFNKTFTVSVVAGDVIYIVATVGEGNTYNESISAA